MPTLQDAKVGNRGYVRQLGIVLAVGFCGLMVLVALFDRDGADESALPTLAVLASATEVVIVPTDNATATPTATATFTPKPSETYTHTPEPTTTGTNTPTITATSTITDTPSPTATPTAYSLESSLLEIEGVERVFASHSISDGLAFVYLEVVVQEGFRMPDMADALLQMTSATLGTGLYSGFSAIIDDGVMAEDYVFDFEDDEWRITSLESVNQSQPTAQTFTCPSNCDGAVAMGLTAEQAAMCPGLDRDHDGVACYGD